MRHGRGKVVRKVPAPHTLPALARARGIAPLDDKARHEAVEDGAALSAAREEGKEIFGKLRNFLRKKLDFQIAKGCQEGN